MAQDGEPPAAAGRRAREDLQKIEKIFTVGGADDVVSVEHRLGDSVGADQRARMRLRRRGGGLGGSDLEHDDRLAGRARTAREIDECRALPDALQIAADHRDAGVVQQVAGEVGELEIALVARAHEMAEAKAFEIGLGEKGGAEGAALRHQGDVARLDALPIEELADRRYHPMPQINRADGVGTNEADAPVPGDGDHLLLEGLAGRAELRETRGQHQGDLDVPAWQRPQHVRYSRCRNRQHGEINWFGNRFE